MKIVLDINQLSTRSDQESRQWPQILAVVTATIMSVVSGFQAGWPSPCVPKLLSGDMGFEVSDDEVSYIVMIAPLGVLIGSPSSGILLDKIGRKYTLLLLAIPQIVAMLMIATAKDVPTLYVARFITGIADGALFTALPIYVCEVLEPKIRGILGTSHSIGLISGILLINAYGSFMPIRTSAYISLSVPLLFLVTFIWMPKSPYYLLMKGRFEEARCALQWLRRSNHVEEELAEISAYVSRQNSEPGQLKHIFTIYSNRKAFLILLALRTFQQFAGIGAISFYIQIIFDQSDGALSPAKSAIICNGILMLVAAFSSYLVDRLGRKPLFMFSSVASAIVLVIIGLYFSFLGNGYDMSLFTWVPIICFVMYHIVVGVGLLIIPNLMIGELFSANIKSKASTLLGMYLGLCVSGSSKLFQLLYHDYGIHVPFFFFGACCAVSAVFCYFFFIETKGKSLEEIQQIFEGNRRTRSYQTFEDNK